MGIGAAGMPTDGGTMNPAVRLGREAVVNSIHRRWGVLDWDTFYPWWRRPASVRILMYAEGGVRFEGGPFLGLKYVSSLLQSRAYPYVKFEIATAHRAGSDPTATIAGAKKLTDLDILANYDEIWFFGTGSTPVLEPGEIAQLTAFMAAPKFGGVLVTGDHASLGRSIAGQVPRAGSMRLYPAPDAIPPGWNTTLEEGPDPGATFDFDEQSDEKPQTIRWRRYPVSSPFLFRYRPHPVLCGPDGPINVLPDHEHEGEALAPLPTAGAPEWPTKGGHQQAPEVIAWGRIKNPAATKHGQEIGVISAYDGHNVDAGRILADATWHHWFDINLTGVAAPPSPYAGFDETTAGAAALKKIDAYFLNAGVWLAPPDKQRQMRYFGWWSILWTDRIFEISPKAPLGYLGGVAIDALGKRAPRCTVQRWILEPIFKERIPSWEWPMWLEKFKVLDPPVEVFAAGGILQQLIRDFRDDGTHQALPDRCPDDTALDRVLSTGIEQGLRALGQELGRDLETANKLMSALRKKD
jgi:hypothetical protein